MDLPSGPSREQSPSLVRKKSMKTHKLTDDELRSILDNDQWISSDDDFDSGSNDEFGDFDDLAKNSR